MTMQLKTASILLVVLISFVAPYSAMAQDSTITCEVPTVETGQQTQLICDFKQDISALNSYIATVEFYPPDVATPVEITECRAVGGSKSCTEADGYTVDHNINTHMYINITKVSSRNAGRFLCKVLSPETKPLSEPCFFYLADATMDAPKRTTPGDSISVDSSDDSDGGFPIIPVAAGAGGGVVLLAAVVIVVVYLCKRKSSKERTTENGEEYVVTPSDEDAPPPIPKREPIILASVNGEPYEADLGEGNPLLPVSTVDDLDPPPKPPRLSISSPGQGEEERNSSEQIASPDTERTDEPPESNDTAVESSDVFEPPSES